LGIFFYTRPFHDLTDAIASPSIVFIDAFASPSHVLRLAGPDSENGLKAHAFAAHVDELLIATPVVYVPAGVMAAFES
jgi:hypothetical protein